MVLPCAGEGLFAKKTLSLECRGCRVGLGVVQKPLPDTGLSYPLLIRFPAESVAVFSKTSSCLEAIEQFFGVSSQAELNFTRLWTMGASHRWIRIFFQFACLELHFTCHVAGLPHEGISQRASRHMTGVWLALDKERQLSCLRVARYPVKLVRHKTAVGLMGAKSAGLRARADPRALILQSPQAQPKLLVMSSFSSTATLRRRLATGSLQNEFFRSWCCRWPAASSRKIGIESSWTASR